jgi:2-polyprenyl-3-methyl-5-hydroxy-6-metoxy-1,4-benzoquinol methylase
VGLLDLFHKKAAEASPQAGAGTEEFWRRPFDRLRAKWAVVPLSAQGRARSQELLELPDADLLQLWQEALAEQTEGAGFQLRGWYHTLYAEALRGKRVLDVGSGLGFSSLSFARQGAQVTFVDLAPNNLKVLERLCGLLGVRSARFVLLQDLGSLAALPTDFDVITAIGSLHHAPVSVIRPEVQELVKHLKVGGRWLQFAYPRARWEREGSLPFHEWGEKTDGIGTPWAEWYDMPKLLELFRPHRFEPVFYYEWHNQDFNWFDLVYCGREDGALRRDVAGSEQGRRTG